MTGANLTVDTVVPYLLKRNLVSVAAIVEGDLEVVDAGRRNQNLKVAKRCAQPGNSGRIRRAFGGVDQHNPSRLP